ncbi:MAG: nitroreductase family protein [Anaerolineales bacterium]|jgi:F420 biosynthesis protein FbiB-like protein
MASDRSAFYQILRARRSVRRFDAEPIEREVLLRLIEAATLAPSAHNSQPWRFAVLTDSGTRRRLGKAMGEAFRSDLESEGRPPEEIARAVGRSRQRLEQAPAAIVIALSLRDADRYADARRQDAEHTMAVQGAALAAENLLLAAHAEGLGSCWVCWPLFCPDLVSRELNLPADWEPLAMVLVGRPAQPVPPAQRQPPDQIMVWR